MNELIFKGPYRFEGDDSIFQENANVNGVYIWCVKTESDLYRVYYVGEAQDVKRRHGDHFSKHLSGLYSGHCIESLKNNIRILMHRAGEGMVPRYSHLDSADFNRTFANNLYLFYAEIPSGDSDDNKWLRCRHESALAFQIENSGPNILSVGHLRFWKGDKFKAQIRTPGSKIEYLTDQVVEI